MIAAICPASDLRACTAANGPEPMQQLGQGCAVRCPAGERGSWVGAPRRSRQAGAHRQRAAPCCAAAEPAAAVGGGGQKAANNAVPVTPAAAAALPRVLRDRDYGALDKSQFSLFVQFFRQASPYIEGHRGRTFVLAIPGEVRCGCLCVWLPSCRSCSYRAGDGRMLLIAHAPAIVSTAAQLGERGLAACLAACGWPGHTSSCCPCWFATSGFLHPAGC